MVSLLVLTVLSFSAASHESRPVYIELNETAPQRYQLQWKIPVSVPAFNTPLVTLPTMCEAQGHVAEFSGRDGLVRRIGYSCAKDLAGQAIGINYPGPSPSISTLIRYSNASGERHISVLSPHEKSWTLPHGETRSAVARQYALLGIEHIWEGLDHLLFLLCLLWIAGTRRRILVTITGFSLAHSASLILSALQVVSLPIPPVEATIALSVVLLANEVVRGPRRSLTWRYPIAVSSSFGLLHGFGFAAALSEIGLPQTELVIGLLCFNLGVEIGQVLFAGGVIGLMRLVQRLGSGWLPEYPVMVRRTVTGYAVGALAIFWLIDRGAAF